MPGPSVAALLLRVALGAVLAGHGAWTWQDSAAWGTLCLVAGALLLAGLFTYAAAILAAICIFGLHLAVLAAAVKSSMWSLLLYAAAIGALLWLARWDDFALSRYWPASRTATLAHRGPEQHDWRLDLIVLLLRTALGLDFIAAGLSKFQYDWVGQAVSGFRSTVLPSPAVLLFATALPYVQVIAGASLWAGLFTRASACCVAVTLLLLIAGQLAAGESLPALWSMFLYVLPAVAVLALPAPNRLSLDHLFARDWRRTP